ncbi:MAG: DNA mismatch repair protein MutS [Bacillota bacterium]|nr:DNA mismatch repair protein MutS [Bacillota bacterium]
MKDGLFPVLVIVAAIVISFIASKVTKANKRSSLRLKISSQWGKKAERKYTDEDFSSISSFYKNVSELGENRNIIDDITWYDLDMDNVFKRLNSTQSNIGEEYLYNLLRRPSFDQTVLEERDRLVNLFGNKKLIREKLQFIFASLGKAKFVNISDYFFGKAEHYSSNVFIYKLLSAAALISPFLLIFNIGFGFTMIIITFIINMLIHYRLKNIIGAQLEILAYIIGMTSSAKKIVKENIPELKQYNAILEENIRDIKKITRKAFYIFSVNNGDIFTEYFRIILLREAIDYESIMNTIYKHNEQFKKVYETIGLLDSMISIASFRKSISYYTVPKLNTGSDNRALDFKEIYHPLISDPVTNSLSTSDSVLLTGSNASGKSTFLKTVALNAIFAQTIYTCLAKEYSSGRFMVFSSMALKDNLFNNESYFIVEIKSLKRILDYLNEDVPCLCFIDEVLRGTNTVERVSASSQILYSLSKSNCLCFAATHDIELTNILNKNYKNFHFQEKIEDNKIIFDYKLYEGKSMTRNAIKLLGIMGYEDKVVKLAEDRANKFISQGKWDIIG